ncbi:hypothetical protein WJX84_008870 [Apatococcus fuscideae]|uniref:Uncharacterized protein n=1 Tax=Apatococcus fuscideae TaxID=2026836 RepID=A0AAW1T6V0_9CHLO
MASSTAHKLCSSPLALTRPVAAASSRCARLVVRAQQERPATAVESRVFQIQSWASSVVKPAEQNKKLADTKERIDKELASAISQLDSEKEDALKNLDEQVNKLAGEILERVLPEGVKV